MKPFVYVFQSACFVKETNIALVNKYTDIFEVQLIHFMFFLIFVWVRARVFQENMIFKKKMTTHHALAWGLVWRDPKGFLILTKFKGSSGHLKIDAAAAKSAT